MTVCQGLWRNSSVKIMYSFLHTPKHILQKFNYRNSMRARNIFVLLSLCRNYCTHFSFGTFFSFDTFFVWHFFHLALFSFGRNLNFVLLLFSGELFIWHFFSFGTLFIWHFFHLAQIHAIFDSIHLYNVEWLDFNLIKVN